MFSSKVSLALISIVVFILVITTISFPVRTAAQIRPVEVAQGFALNRFADPDNVPEFASSAYAGPTSMAFDARGRLFVGTLSGKVLILLDNNDDGRADQVKTFATGIPQVLGVEFRSNGDLFVTSNLLAGVGSIIRLRDLDGDDVADEKTTIVNNLPSEGDHQTDRLKFGPDGLLYFGQGSSTDNGTAKPGRPVERPFNASILRLDVDNPATLEVFATGLRNPFGMTFHPENGQLFSTDGGSGEVCQTGGCGEDTSPPEEVNWVVQGGNYGFPLCEGTPDQRPDCAGVRAPAIQYPRHLTPTSLVFYTGPQAGEFKNNLLLTLYKNLHNADNYGGDLRRIVVEGDAASGFRLRDAGFIAQFEPIDPYDGPVDTAIDPISGDIYVVRLDPVTHRDPNEHHHFIYRIHRDGSDALPFIGNLRPANAKAGSAATTISLTGRHLKPGAVVFNVTDDAPLVTRQGASIFEIVADIPASALQAERAIVIEARNADGSRSNQLSFAVTRDVPPPPQGVTPQLTSLFVYKKKRGKVVNPVFAGSGAKKLKLVVEGIDFDAGAQLLVAGTPIEIVSASETELIGQVTSQMLAAPGELNVQVRNSNNKVSNVLKLTIAP